MKLVWDLYTCKREKQKGSVKGDQQRCSDIQSQMVQANIRDRGSLLFYWEMEEGWGRTAL